MEKLQSGMVLERPIYARGGRILLDKGTMLKESYIKRMVDFGVTHAYIFDERLSDLVITDIVNEETRLRAAELVHKAMDDIRLGVGLDSAKTKETVKGIIKQILTHREALAYLSEIRIAGEQLFHHSVTVAVYAILTGVNIQYREESLLDLGTGALLHDIGKSRLPDRILHAKRPLAEAEIEERERHTLYGYEILRGNGFNLMVAHVAYQHHECFNGSGYPRRLKGDEIHEYAGVTAIANIYDKLVNGLDEKRLPPYQAVEYITAHAGVSFEQELARMFCTNIAVYPLGSLVKLNTGEKGFVIHIPKNYPTRPVIRMIEDSLGRSYRINFPEIDLLKELTIFIEEIIDWE